MEVAMNAYVVSFFNNLCGGTGIEQRVCQRRIVIRNAASAEDAIRAAKDRFAAEEKVAGWELHACEIDARCVGEGERIATEH
jgi:hypothetical protein